MSVCIFCHRHIDRPEAPCTYGMHHEYPDDLVHKKPVQAKPVDKKLCHKCGLHPKNPKYAVNGCDHDHQ